MQEYMCIFSDMNGGSATKVKWKGANRVLQIIDIYSRRDILSRSLYYKTQVRFYRDYLTSINKET